MNLLFIAALLLTILCHASPRPVSEENTTDVADVASTHFGKIEDYEDYEVDEDEISPQEDPLDAVNDHPYNFNLTNNGSGNYYFEFKTFDLERYEVGELKNAGTENEIQVVRGNYSYRYLNENGVDVVRTIGYIADENGYRPFLISLSIDADILKDDFDVDVPGGPEGPKTGISSAALGSLIGGNTLG